MNSANKQVIFELQRDPILRPYAYDLTVFLNYFIKGEWSLVPMYRGLHSECKSILGLLTSTHQLLIYGRANRRYSTKGWTEPWEILIDLTDVYNKLLLKTWSKTTSSNSRSSHFDSYKNRAYELAIVDFLWIPDWDLGPDYKYADETKGVFKTLLITFHANGDACIWKIRAAKVLNPKYFARIMYKKNLFHDDIISSVSYSYVSSTLGLLVVGTNKGKLVAYRIENIKQEKGEESETFQPYVIHDSQDLWGEDMLRIESILMKSESSGRTKVSIVAVKHPNILIASSLAVLKLKVLSEEFDVLKVPNGLIVGLCENADGLLMVSHEPGVLALVSWNNGKLKYIPESRFVLFDPTRAKKKKVIDYGSVQKLEKPKKIDFTKEQQRRLVFQGLGLSRNKTMLCVARSVGMYYDHLKIRKPSQIVFYSLLPEDITWGFVQKLYAENSFSLRAISDVLVPFRFMLRGKSTDTMYEEILRWASPLSEKSTAELRLLHWCLKFRPGPTEADWTVAKAEKEFIPKFFKRLSAIVALNKYRVDVVVDRIMQRRCASLIKAVSEHQDQPQFSLEIEINKQCLQVLYTFLMSKDEPISSVPPMPEFDPLPHIPLCYWCKGPIEFPLEKYDYRFEFEEVFEEFRIDFDEERITGFKWRSRRHPVKDYGIHRPEIGILSLLPIQFPYRKCQNCAAICLMEPAFGQRPFCPLCNAFMYPSTLPLHVPEGLEGRFEEGGEIEEQENQQASSTSRPQYALPQLERAEPFIPEQFVKQEPMEYISPDNDEEEMDVVCVPHLRADPVEEFTTQDESASSSENDSDNEDSSSKTSSSDESGNESSTSSEGEDESSSDESD